MSIGDYIKVQDSIKIFATSEDNIVINEIIIKENVYEFVANLIHNYTRVIDDNDILIIEVDENNNYDFSTMSNDTDTKLSNLEIANSELNISLQFDNTKNILEPSFTNTLTLLNSKCSDYDLNLFTNNKNDIIKKVNKYHILRLLYVLTRSKDNNVKEAYCLSSQSKTPQKEETSNPIQYNKITKEEYYAKYKDKLLGIDVPETIYQDFQMDIYNSFDILFNQKRIKNVWQCNAKKKFNINYLKSKRHICTGELNEITKSFLDIDLSMQSVDVYNIIMKDLIEEVYFKLLSNRTANQENFNEQSDDEQPGDEQPDDEQPNSEDESEVPDSCKKIACENNIVDSKKLKEFILKHHPDKVSNNKTLSKEDKEKMIELYKSFNAKCDNYKDEIKANKIDCQEIAKIPSVEELNIPSTKGLAAASSDNTNLLENNKTIYETPISSSEKDDESQKPMIEDNFYTDDDFESEAMLRRKEDEKRQFLAEQQYQGGGGKSKSEQLISQIDFELHVSMYLQKIMKMLFYRYMLSNQYKINTHNFLIENVANLIVFLALNIHNDKYIVFYITDLVFTGVAIQAYLHLVNPKEYNIDHLSGLILAPYYVALI